MKKHSQKNGKSPKQNPLISNQIHELLTKDAHGHDMSPHIIEEAQSVRGQKQDADKSAKSKTRREADKQTAIPAWQQQAGGKTGKKGQNGLGNFQSKPRSSVKNYRRLSG